MELISNLYIVQTAGTLQELSWELNAGHPTPFHVFITSDVSISKRLFLLFEVLDSIEFNRPSFLWLQI